MQCELCGKDVEMPTMQRRKVRCCSCKYLEYVRFEGCVKLGAQDAAWRMYHHVYMIKQSKEMPLPMKPREGKCKAHLFLKLCFSMLFMAPQHCSVVLQFLSPAIVKSIIYWISNELRGHLATDKFCKHADIRHFFRHMMKATDEHFGALYLF